MAEIYDRAAIQALLLNGFSETDLRRFCTYTTEFNTVRRDLSRSDGLATIVEKILDYAEQQDLFAVILNWAEAENPNRYRTQGPYTTDEVPPSQTSVTESSLKNQPQSTTATTYNIHINEASGLAIGDQAQAILGTPPGTERPSSTSSEPSNILTARRRRLEQRYQEAQAAWDTLTARMNAVQQDLSTEMDGERKLTLEQRLSTLQNERDQVEKMLTQLESELE